MPMLAWNDDLSVGVDEIDAQHKTLVAMVNTLYDSMCGDASSQTLLDIVAEMRRYAAVHFGTEERYMARHAYPGLDDHRVEHENFVAKVDAVESDCKSGKLALSMDILNFLSNWLVTHIHDTDKKMGRFLVTAMH